VPICRGSRLVRSGRLVGISADDGIQAKAKALDVLRLTRRGRSASRVGEGSFVSAAIKSEGANLGVIAPFGAVTRRAAGPEGGPDHGLGVGDQARPNRGAVRIAAGATEQANVAFFLGAQLRSEGSIALRLA
jgi:hypothetical protein